MTSLRDTITEAKCQALQSIVDTGTAKYLCFTRLDNQQLLLCCSDGCDVWRLELDTDELDTHRDLADMNVDAYLSKFRSSFVSGDISVAQHGVKVSLSLGRGANTLDFELYEAKAIVRKTELQNVLFHLAERATDLEVQLDKANLTIDSLKQQKGTNKGGAGIFDLGDAKKAKIQAKAQTKQAGMSVINPSSKKRKAAKGVQFN